tara:strand:- start:403 stop:2862 length:2460 start_codon:yes stop_codon:yes gene_type:complete
MRFSSDEQIVRLVEKVENEDPTKTDAANFSRLLKEMVEEAITESEADKKLIDKVLAFLKKQPDYKNAELKKIVGGDNPRVQITNLGGDAARKNIAQLLASAGFAGVEVLDRKNVKIGSQRFEWIQGAGGKGDAKDPMCGNAATCFENNIIWGVKYFVDPAKALEFFDPSKDTGTIFGDCVDANGKFDPSKKGCAGNYIVKGDIEAGKTVAETLRASVEEVGSLVDAGEVSGQTFELAKGYADSGVTSGEPKTDISITTEKDGVKKVWNCSVKEAVKSKGGNYDSGGQFASAQGNELAAIVKTALGRVDDSVLKSAMTEAKMTPDQVGNMLQAVMARTTVYKARKNLLQTGGAGVAAAGKAGVAGKGEQYSQVELEEDALPYPTASRASLMQEEPKDYTSGTDVEQYRSEIDDAEKAGKLKNPSWKSGSEERSFESDFSAAQKSVLGKAMSYSLGFDDAIRLSDADMQPLVQETKDAFGGLLESSGETKKLKDDVLKEIFGTPLPVPQDMIEGQARFDAAQSGQSWENLKAPEKKALLKSAKEKLIIVAQVKMAESIRQGLEDFQNVSSEGMRKIFQNQQLRIEMLREAVTGVGKFKDGAKSPAVPNAIVTWNRDGYAKFVSLEGTQEDPLAWFRENVDNVRIELRDRGTGRGFAGRAEKHQQQSLRPREMQEGWKAIDDSILLEDFMHMMGAGDLIFLEENLDLLDSDLITEEMLLEALSWSDVTKWTKDKIAKGAEKGQELLGKVKDFGREIIAGAKEALQRAIAAAKQFYAQMKKLFAQLISKLSSGIKGILSKDPIGGLTDVTGLIPEVSVSKLEI